MQDSGNDANDTSQTMKDKIFLRHAAEGGMAEVKLGQLATQKASSDDVKAFGQKMVDDHTMLNNEMAPIADSMGVRTPKGLNKEAQAEYDKLNGLSDAEFDKEYINVMEKDHHDALDLFNEEAKTTTDAKFKVTVMHGQSVVAAHTHMADSLGAKI